MLLLYLFGVIFCLFLSAFFSGSESGFYFLSKEKLAMRVAQGDISATRLTALLQNPGEFITTMLIGNTVAIQGATYACILLLQQVGFSGWGVSVETATTILLFFPFFFFGEVFPKATYRLHAVPLLCVFLPLLLFFKRMFWPFSKMVTGLKLVFDNLASRKPEKAMGFDRALLTMTMGHAYAGGVLSEEQVETIWQTLHSGDSRVEARMVSLLKAPLVAEGASLVQLKQLYQVSGKSVFPVYQKRKTNIVGTLDLKKLVLRGSADEDPFILMQKPSYIEKGETFSKVLSMLLESDIPVVYVRSKDKVLGYIDKEDALCKLLR